MDPDKDDVEGFTSAVYRRAKRQGLPKDRVRVDRSLRVDEKELQRMIDKGEVVLLEGAWDKQTKSWRIDPEEFTKNEDVKLAAERAAEILQAN